MSRDTVAPLALECHVVFFRSSSTDKPIAPSKVNFPVYEHRHGIQTTNVQLDHMLPTEQKFGYFRQGAAYMHFMNV